MGAGTSSSSCDEGIREALARAGDDGRRERYRWADALVQQGFSVLLACRFGTHGWASRGEGLIVRCDGLLPI